ncbi:DNA-binding protein [Anoxybacillus gonensis]|uniref:DNA-binding protein n=1 Tax=Anoxybacillus gonensis TaxID=198467 RepID=UPI003F731969
MKRLKITNGYGWTPRTLRKLERKIKDASVRVAAVRPVIEGHLDKDVEKMVNLYCQSVALYVAHFNEGGLDHLLDRRLPPGCFPFLMEEQQEIRQLVLTTTSVDVGWGISSSWNTRILQSYIQQTYGVQCHVKVFVSDCIVFACHGHARLISLSKAIQCFKRPLKKNLSL